MMFCHDLLKDLEGFGDNEIVELSFSVLPDLDPDLVAALEEVSVPDELLDLNCGSSSMANQLNVENQDLIMHSAD
jgi:hypothetical protein